MQKKRAKAIPSASSWRIPEGSDYGLAVSLSFQYRPSPSELDRLALETTKDRDLHLEAEFPLGQNIYGERIPLRGFVAAIPRNSQGQDMPFPPVEIREGKLAKPDWIGKATLPENGFFLDGVEVRLISEGFYSRTYAHKEWSDGKKIHFAKYMLPSDPYLSEGFVEYTTIGLASEMSKREIERPTTERIYSEHSIQVKFGKTSERGYSVLHRYFVKWDEREITLRNERLDYGAFGELKGFYSDGSRIENGRAVRDARLKYFQSDRNVPRAEVMRKLSQVFTGEKRIDQIRELGHARF